MTTATEAKPEAKNGTAPSAEPEVELTPWQRLRAPFPPEKIGKLPRKNKDGSKVLLDYVGHADTTDRMIEVDPQYWSWRPMSRVIDHAILAELVKLNDTEVVATYIDSCPPRFETNANGQPVGLWIYLTILDKTLPGFGSVAAGKFDAEKELIGDALRNGALRFGIALDLWRKESKHQAENDDDPDAPRPGVDRDWQEGDACPACVEKGARGRLKVAKGGRNAGSLQCTGKVGEAWQNHPAPPFEAAQTTALATTTSPAPFQGGERPVSTATPSVRGDTGDFKLGDPCPVCLLGDPLSTNRLGGSRTNMKCVVGHPAPVSQGDVDRVKQMEATGDIDPDSIPF